MNITLTGIFISIFLILPGFLSSHIQRMIIEDNNPVQYWIPVSILRSIYLNALLFVFVITTGLFGFNVIYISISDQIFQSRLVEILDHYEKIQIINCVAYLIWLLAFSIITGVILGIVTKRWKHLVFARGWSPVSPFQDVWTGSLSEEFSTKENLQLRNSEEQFRPWLRIVVDNKTALLGLMTRSNVVIDREKPIEVFLKPAFKVDIETGKVVARDYKDTTHVGIYLRIDPKQYVEVISAQANWSPYIKQEINLKS